MPQLERFQSGKDIARMDRPLAEAVVRMNVPTLRRLAFWAAVQAYEYAGLADRGTGFARPSTLCMWDNNFRNPSEIAQRHSNTYTRRNSARGPTTCSWKSRSR